jgi:AraC-like DNA-binding protein
MTGESPGAYLTRWRMRLAARRLRDTGDSLEAIAQPVEYTSVYTFSRAFSRVRSQPPGQYRSRSRAQTDDNGPARPDG